MAAERKPAAEWIFVIKTDKYAGNFERPLCGYMTGMVGVCGVGAEEAQIFYEELGLNDNWNGVSVESCGEDFGNPFALVVTDRADDHGNRRPASIWRSGEEKEYNSVAIFFSEKPTDDLIALMIERARKYVEEYCPNAEEKWDRHKIKILGFELWREETREFIERSWPA